MDYQNPGPTREEVDAWTGPLLLEFGTGWCGFCQGAQPYVTEAIGMQPGVTHLKVEDGPGRPLGRSFRVKLWPTLLFMKDGKELHRVVRPSSAGEIIDGLQLLR